MFLITIIKHDNMPGDTGYDYTGEVMKFTVRVHTCFECTAGNHVCVIAVWREVWDGVCSYHHCCSPLGLQRWCNGKMACHQIHPLGDLREIGKRWAQPGGQEGPGRPIKCSPFSVSVTWFTHSSYLASSYKENMTAVTQNLPRSMSHKRKLKLTIFGIPLPQPPLRMLVGQMPDRYDLTLTHS